MTDEKNTRDDYERRIEALVSKLSDALDRNTSLLIQLTETQKRIRELELENGRLGGLNRRIRLEGDDP